MVLHRDAGNPLRIGALHDRLFVWVLFLLIGSALAEPDRPAHRQLTLPHKRDAGVGNANARALFGVQFATVPADQGAATQAAAALPAVSSLRSAQDTTLLRGGQDSKTVLVQQVDSTLTPIVQEPAYDWVVLHAPGVNVRVEKNPLSAVTSVKKAGEVVHGRQIGDWVALDGEAGYMMRVQSGEDLLRRKDAQGEVGELAQQIQKENQQVPLAATTQWTTSAAPAVVAPAPLASTLAPPKVAPAELPIDSEWKVVYSPGVNVRVARDTSSAVLASHKTGEIVSGHQVDGDWLVMAGEPGFMKIEQDGTILMIKAHVATSPPHSHGGEAVPVASAYKFVGFATGTDAASLCVRNGHKHVAMPKTERELQALQAAFVDQVVASVNAELAAGKTSQKQHPNAMWLGAEWSRDKQRWEWDDGTSIRQFKWAFREPSSAMHQLAEPYLCMGFNGEWHDAPTSHTYGVMCQEMEQVAAPGQASSNSTGAVSRGASTSELTCAMRKELGPDVTIGDIVGAFWNKVGKYFLGACILIGVLAAACLVWTGYRQAEKMESSRLGSVSHAGNNQSSSQDVAMHRALVYIACSFAVPLATLVVIPLLLGLAYPVLLRMEWQHVERAVAFCMKNVWFSKYVVMIYGLKTLADILHVINAHVEVPEPWDAAIDPAGDTFWGMGPPIFQDFIISQVMDTYTVAAIVVSVVHLTPDWYVYLWGFCVASSALTWLVALSFQQYKTTAKYFGQLLLVTLIADQAPKLVLSAVALLMPRVVGGENAVNQYVVFCLVGAILRSLKLAANLNTGYVFQAVVRNGMAFPPAE